MPLINSADSLMKGTTPIQRAYAGNVLVWERIKLVTKTWSGNASWSGTYDGSNDRRTDGSSLYYGWYSSVWGNQRSLFGFNLPADLAGCEEVTSLRVKFYNRHHYLNSGGRVYLGTHDYTSRPSTWSGSRVDEQRNNYAAPKPGWVDLTLGSAWREDFRSGAAKGFALGPGPSNSQSYYGYADDHTQSNEPWMSITYKVWE